MWAGDDDSTFERPLTDAEREFIRKVQRAPIVGLGRVFGTLLGIIPLFFVLLSIAGSPFDPLNTTVILIVAPILAVVLATASFARRGGATVALTRGTAREVWGVPGARTARPPTSVEFELGSTKFVLRKPQAAAIGDGCLNAIAIVVAPLSGLGARRPGMVNALLIGINGKPVERFATCYVTPQPGTVEATLAAKVARKAALAR